MKTIVFYEIISHNKKSTELHVNNLIQDLSFNEILIESQDFPKCEKSESSTLFSVNRNLFTQYPAQGDI